jgi:CheY-like chemotaxis protein
MPPEEELTPSSEKLIMIVDDDDSVRELLEFVVQKEGFKVASARDGEEGLNKIREMMPNLILLDLMLPKYGGFEILRQLQSGPTASIPIVIVTGRYSDRSTAEMIRQESNVVDFLEKPVKPPVLAMNLHRLLKTKPAIKGPAANW